MEVGIEESNALPK